MNILPVDLEKFWKEDKVAHEDNCFSMEATQVALGLRMSEECVLAEFGEELDNPMWMQPPRERRIELNKRYNDKAEKIVGIRLLAEDFPPDELRFPKTKRIGEVFGGKYSIHGGSEWLRGDLVSPGQLEAKLYEIDKMDLREFILPHDWEEQCRIIFEKTGKRPPPQHSVRGPVTLACSLIGVENFIFMLIEEPDLGKRFSDTITRVIIEMTEILDAEAGIAATAEAVADGEAFGFQFYDDNCCMLNAELYEFFGYPILKQVFERFSPKPHHERYQHSDSAMEHLLPVLGKLGFNGVNFGPTVTIDKIREYMPKARIDGCISPMTFMSGNIEKIISEVRRDCEMAKQYGRGVNIYTAGSINFGSTLAGMRAAMWAICEYGKY